VTAPDDFATEAEERVYRGRPEPPLGTLINSLVEDLRRLVRLEIALFKQEMALKAGRLKVGLIAIAIGAVLAFTAWLAMFAAAIIALTIVWPAWLATVVLGAMLLVFAGLVLFLGIRSLRMQTLAPQRTLNSLREVQTAIKERMR
jgi:Putative Actinobacterial Holin-X, holin superfamily III